MIEHVETAMLLAQQLPNPGPKPPPGSAQIEEIAAYVKWGAGLALVVAFFAGLIVWSAGRLVDHRGAGRSGVVMMLCAIGGGLLYGIGYQVISSFAGVK